MSDLSGWEVVAAAATAVAAAGGLVFGVRAELRANRYEPRFDLDTRAVGDQFRVTATNRTGESAKQVQINFRKPGDEIWYVVGMSAETISEGDPFWALLTAEQYLDPHPEITVSWFRAATMVRYEQFEYVPDRRKFRERIGDGIRGAQPGFRKRRPRGYKKKWL